MAFLNLTSILTTFLINIHQPAAGHASIRFYAVVRELATTRSAVEIKSADLPKERTNHDGTEQRAMIRRKIMIDIQSLEYWKYLLKSQRLSRAILSRSTPSPSFCEAGESHTLFEFSSLRSHAMIQPSRSVSVPHPAKDIGLNVWISRGFLKAKRKSN
jgi:hypothetical protein